LNGLLDPVEPGLACGSDTAHMSLFGYDPRLYYRGRGAFESMGAGMEMLPGDIAFKSNFAVLDEGSGRVVKRRADRHFEVEGPLLCGDLNGRVIPGFDGKYTLYVRYATEHRCGVVIRGPGLTDGIHGTDPLVDGRDLLRALPVYDTCEAMHTANVVNAASDYIRRVLKDHPVNRARREQGKDEANVVLLRGCGCRLSLENFNDMYGFENSCMVAPTKIIAGVGMCVGMTVLHVPGATGDYRSDFHSKAVSMASAMIQTYDFGFLHVKAVDDASHDKNAGLKVACIHVVDAMIGQLVRMLYDAGEDAVIAVTGDHSTPVEYGDHSHEPVPVAMSTVYGIVDILGEDGLRSSIPIGTLPKPEDVMISSDDSMLLQRSKLLYRQIEDRGSPCRFDSVGSFSERDAPRGCLGRFPGSCLMGMLIRFAENF